jgi:anti-sigma regulatory factor (Ser/Thr protein kinase)
VDTVDRRIFARSYPGRLGQPRLVRAALAPLLMGCPRADDAVLIASELAANAAVHSNSAAPGGQFTVRAGIRGEDYIWIEVEDQVAHGPAAGAPAVTSAVWDS